MTWDNTFVQDQAFETFVRNTLEKYPFGVGVFQEWLANADDAKASNFKVAFDSTTYNTSVWGGPSILIYNNQCFSPQDWVGFTKKLGNSGKRDDADSIGKFGLGSITFYHLTDVISVVSGDQLLILDMLQQDHLLNSRSVKGSYLQDTTRFSHVLNPIAQQPFFTWDPKTKFPGTIFRLPIRLQGSAMKKNAVPQRHIEEFLDQSVHQAPDQLHFLQHVEAVEIFQLKDRKVKLLVRVEIPITEAVRKQRHRAVMHQESIPHTITSCFTFQYDVTVTKGNSKESHKSWEVFLGSAYLTANEIEKLNVERDFLEKMQPRGGIAICVDPNTKLPIVLPNGKGYCFLPILKDYTGLPFHVNGLFQLNDNRTDIWMTTNSDHRTRWNKLILEHVIGPLWAYALHQMAARYKKINVEDKFFEFFPKKLQYPWSVATNSILHCFRNLPIFHSECGKILSASDAYYSDDPEKEASYRMLARKCQIPYVEIPKWLIDLLRENSVNLNYLVPRNISKLLKDDPARGELISNLPLQDKVTLAHLLCKEEHAKGLPLVPRINGTFGVIGERKHKVCLTEKRFITKMFPNAQLVDHTSDLYTRVRYIAEQCEFLSKPEIEAMLPNHWKGSIGGSNIDPDLAELIEDSSSPLFQYSKEIGHHLLVLQLDDGKFCSVEYAKNTCVLMQQLYPRKEKIIKSLSEKLGLRICRRIPLAVMGLVESSCYSKNIVYTAFCYVANGNRAHFASLLEQCQDKELTNEMLHAEHVDNVGMFAHTKILLSQTNSFISPQEAILLSNEDATDWSAILGPMANFPENKQLASKLGVMPLSNIEFFFQHVAAHMPSFPAAKQDDIARLLVRKYNNANPKMQQYLINTPIVKVDNSFVKISDLISPKPEIVAFFEQDHTFPVVPYAWHPHLNVLRSLGFDTLPITKIVLQLKTKWAKQNPQEVLQKVINLLARQETFMTLKPHPIFPAWEPTNPIFSLGPVRAGQYFPLDEMDSPTNASLVWTVRPILHEGVDPDKAHQQGLRQQPSLKDVIKHFKNVVELLNGPLYAKFFPHEWDLVITNVLTFLTKHAKAAQIKELEPLAFVRVKSGFVSPARLCFDLHEDLENEAFFKVPKALHSFKSLLAALGAQVGLGENVIITLPPAPTDDKKFAARMVAKLAQAFDNPDSFADIQFQVEGRTLHAHRLILSLHSPKFRMQFTGQWLDAKQGTMLVINDPTTSYNALRFLLTYLYTGKPEFALLGSLDDCMNAVQLSGEHFLEELQTHLERHILLNRQYLTVSTVCHLLNYAQLFSMKHLEENCKKYALNSKKAIFALPEFAKLDEGLVERIFGDEGVEQRRARKPLPEENEEQEEEDPIISSSSHVIHPPSQKPTNNNNELDNSSYHTTSPSIDTINNNNYGLAASYASIASGISQQPQPWVKVGEKAPQAHAQSSVASRPASNNRKNKKKKKKVVAKFG